MAGEDLFDTPEHEAFRATARKFAEEEIAPRAREFDEAGRFDPRLYKKMGNKAVREISQHTLALEQPAYQQKLNQVMSMGGKQGEKTFHFMSSKRISQPPPRTARGYRRVGLMKGLSLDDLMRVK